MALPSTHTPILPQDYTLTPFKVNHTYNFSNSGSGYKVREGYYSGIITPVSSSKADNDPKNPDGTFKHIIWKSYFHNYYRYPYQPGKNLTNSDSNEVYKHLTPSASFVTVPYLKMGEGIKAGSVIIKTSSGLELLDDKKGNIYDPEVDIEELYPRNRTIAHWSFSDLYRNFKRGSGIIDDLEFEYNSYAFSMDEKSRIISCSVEHSDYLENSPSLSFNTSSYVVNFNKKDLEIIRDQNLIISFWIKPSSDGNVLTKRGTVISEALYSSKEFYENKRTNIYPYDFKVQSGSIVFSRSDGIREIAMSGSVNYDEWNLITAYAYDDKLALRYPSGSSYEVEIKDDSTKNISNNFNIHFGSSNKTNNDGFSGSLAEVRMMEKTPSGQLHPASGSVSTGSCVLHENPYNTNILGNVFYEYGDLVFSPHHTKYNNILSGSWDIQYKSTKTVFQYECLARIRKGDYNMTSNPSALENYKSDKLIGDFTGSLTPYTTTIGLYNSLGELLVIGKLGQAVKMRDDVDINFLIRWDA